jgi:hypothetical protein
MKEMYNWVAQVETAQGQGQIAVVTEEGGWSLALEKIQKVADKTGGKIIAGPIPQGRVWV